MDGFNLAAEAEAFLLSTQGRFSTYVEQHAVKIPADQRPALDVISEATWLINDPRCWVLADKMIVGTYFDPAENIERATGSNSIEFWFRGQEGSRILLGPNGSAFEMIAPVYQNRIPLREVQIEELLDNLESLEAQGKIWPA